MINPFHDPIKEVGPHTQNNSPIEELKRKRTSTVYLKERLLGESTEIKIVAPHRNGMDSPPEPSPYYIESQKFHDQDIQVDFASIEKTDSPTQTPLLR